ncbi:MAG: UDP-N-acetylmuramoyl-tripeptide--D-alanyl-D-alanine ligase [Gemmatimonadales bacterium]
MIAWTGTRVADILGTGGGSALTYSSVSTDTRSLSPGALFVALVGETFDGHDFVGVARDSGAVGAVVQRSDADVEGLEVFRVDDTLIALGRLARARRQEVTGPVVGVTGTNGKTSTKEMLAVAMGTRWNVHATRENLNNLIGVPLTILTTPLDCDALVVEAGASEPGEIARLRDILEPTLGVVTNVAAGHLEGFGSLQAVLMEKCSLLDGVPVAVVGGDPPARVEEARRRARRVVVAGLSERATTYPDCWGVDPEGHAWLAVQGTRVRLPVLGRHQADNAMISLAVALELGVELADAAAAINRVELPPGRCDLLRSGDRVILKDTYNANPGSLTALLETASALRDDRRLVIVLGTMLELGVPPPDSAELLVLRVQCLHVHISTGGRCNRDRDPAGFSGGTDGDSCAKGARGRSNSACRRTVLPPIEAGDSHDGWCDHSHLHHRTHAALG